MATQVLSGFTDANSQDAWQSLVDRRLLMRGVYDHHFMSFVTKKSRSRNTGVTLLLRRYAALARATTALTEGVTKTGKAKSKTDVNITLAQYGDYIENSDMLENTLPEGTLDDVDQLGQQMGETMDALYGITWATGTNITYSGTATSVATVADQVVYADFNRAMRTLENNKAKRLTPMATASQRVNTGGVMPGYWCILSNSMWFDVRAFTSHFFLAADYSSGSPIRGEGGSLDLGLRFLPVPDADMLAASCIETDAGASGETDVAETVGNQADVHFAICIGEQAVGGLDLGIGNGGIIREALGSAGTADPMHQRSTIAWKKTDGRGVLNQAFFQVVKGAVSS